MVITGPDTTASSPSSGRIAVRPFSLPLGQTLVKLNRIELTVLRFQRDPVKWPHVLVRYHAHNSDR